MENAEWRGWIRASSYLPCACVQFFSLLSPFLFVLRLLAFVFRKVDRHTTAAAVSGFVESSV